jgi:predicted HTH domain antitoxin
VSQVNPVLDLRVRTLILNRKRSRILNTLHYIVSCMENVTTRMDEDEIEMVERLADEMGVSRSDAVRIAVRGGAKDELVRIALQRYQEGEIGMRDAAELAGTTISEMMAEANDRGVLSNYDETDLESDVESLV